jgi:hypothetical protein
MPYLSEFRPFPFAFPDANTERKGELISQPLVEQLANVFDGRVFQEIIPGTMIEVRQRFPEKSLHIREIHHHAVSNVAICNKFNLIGVTVNRTAFGMIGEEVRTVDVFDDADFHDA